MGQALTHFTLDLPSSFLKFYFDLKPKWFFPRANFWHDRGGHRRSAYSDTGQACSLRDQFYNITF
jgi:hypothetical protein